MLSMRALGQFARLWSRTWEERSECINTYSGSLFFDRAADPPQMIAKRDGRTRGTPGKEIGELELRAQGRAAAHLLRLYALGVSNRPGERRDLFRAGRRNEEHPVSVSHRDVIGAHGPTADAGRDQRIGLPRIQPERSGWAAAEAKYGQPDLEKLRRVAVQTPNDHPRQTGPFCLQHDQISDAGFVPAAGVVDHHDFAGRRPF